jgi:hypothetical protein
VLAICEPPGVLRLYIEYAPGQRKFSAVLVHLGEKTANGIRTGGAEPVRLLAALALHANDQPATS